MNFIPAQLQSDASGLCLNLAAGLSLALPTSRFDHLQDRVGSSVLLGVRPEHIQRKGTDRQGMAPIQGDIELVQPTGSRTFVEFKLGETTTIAELQAHDVQRSGERIALDIDMNRVILIDPTSEQVIANGRQH
jgi:multiple sugar transport system ATP-binding protein